MHIEKIGKTINFHLKNIALSRFTSDSEYIDVISPFSRLYLITKGHGMLTLEGNQIELEPEHLYLVPSFLPCSYFFEKELEHIYIHFSVEMATGVNIYNLYTFLKKIKAETDDLLLFQKCLRLNPGYELPHHDPRVYQSKPWIIQEIKYLSIAHYLETTAIITQLFSRFIQEELSNNISKISDRNFQHVLQHIHSNLAQEISIKEMAEKYFTSKDHFSRVFKSIIGIPPSEYIIRKRLEKAQLLLLTTNYPLNEIIRLTGFKTTPYFCRLFKKYTSYTPEGFRKSRG